MAPKGLTAMAMGWWAAAAEATMALATARAARVAAEANMREVVAEQEMATEMEALMGGLEASWVPQR